MLEIKRCGFVAIEKIRAVLKDTHFITDAEENSNERQEELGNWY